MKRLFTSSSHIIIVACLFGTSVAIFSSDSLTHHNAKHSQIFPLRHLYYSHSFTSFGTTMMHYYSYSLATAVLCSSSCIIVTAAFTTPFGIRANQHHYTSNTATRLLDTIVSPFDSSGDDLSAAAPAVAVQDVDQGPLPLTWENVELVLDGMRHYLIQDGGNVKITEIDGPVVRLELQVRTVLYCIA
jgi:hypothetical protein